MRAETVDGRCRPRRWRSTRSRCCAQARRRPSCGSRVDGTVRLAELVCDGALVCTPAGSTAYNYSAHGPILPIGSDVLALTAMAAFRPRRWRGALLPKTAVVRFDVLEAEKRPVMADADSRSVRDVLSVEIRSEPRRAPPHPVRPRPRPGRAADPRAVRLSFAGSLWRRNPSRLSPATEEQSTRPCPHRYPCFVPQPSSLR